MCGGCARLQRPLDVIVVADHTEDLGLAPMIAGRNLDLLKTDKISLVHLRTIRIQDETVEKNLLTPGL